MPLRKCAGGCGDVRLTEAPVGEDASRLQANREIVAARSVEDVLRLSRQREALIRQQRAGESGANVGMVSAATVLNRIAKLRAGQEVFHDSRC